MGAPSAHSGFSLLELLVVIALSALLLSLGLGAYQHIRRDLAEQEAKLDLLEYSQALQSYYQQHLRYTPEALELDTDTSYNFQLEIDAKQSAFELQAWPQAEQSGAGALSIDHRGDRRHYDSDYPSGAYQAW